MSTKFVKKQFEFVLADLELPPPEYDYRSPYLLHAENLHAYKLRGLYSRRDNPNDYESGDNEVRLFLSQLGLSSEH